MLDVPRWEEPAGNDQREESLAQARDFAEDWFLELKGKHRRGEVKGGKTFR